jgi:hypothetical protein
MDILNKDNKLTIGWREWVALPELKIPAVKAKIDTGARTSALYAFDVNLSEVDGQEKICFAVHPLQRKQDVVLYCTADLVEQRMVTDSGGHRELRYVIRTTVAWDQISWPIEMTLTHRENLKFRMLLGRTALGGKFLVDPENSYYAGRALAKSYRKTQAGRKS